MKTIEDFNVNGKKVLLRVDINSPIEKESGKIVLNPRILSHARTIKELSDKGAKLIVLAHQGRRGETDFLNLKGHSEVLSQIIKKPILFIDEVVGPRSKAAIQNLKDGQILLLENVRFMEDEEKGEEGKIVSEIYPLVDYFFLDALSVAHRAHASVVGFQKQIPSGAGRVLKEELEALGKIQDSGQVTFIFGGAKAEDSLPVLKKWIENGKIQKALLGGVLSIMFLKASGKKIGVPTKNFLNSKGLLKDLDKITEFYKKYKEFLVLPLDVGVNQNGQRADCSVDAVEILNSGFIFDIGPKTVEEFKKHIKEAKTIMINGPMGVYEIPPFDFGTREILTAVAAAENFSLVGGGHTITAIEKFSVDKSKFSYISLSGKALIEYLSGKELIGIKALKESSAKFST